MAQIPRDRLSIAYEPANVAATHNLSESGKKNRNASLDLCNPGQLMFFDLSP